VTGLKTNERPGTRAVLRHSHVSAYKAREVLDLIRNEDFGRAAEILEFCDRDVAEVIGKLLNSAAANARHNDGLEPEELFVSACFADEGTTLKRWRPRARGRATRIRKRTCHITLILSRLPETEIVRRRARVAAEAADRRARRVAGARRQGRASASTEASADTTAMTVAPDEEVLDIVSTGDVVDHPDVAAAVDEALASNETEVGPTEDTAAEDQSAAKPADETAGDDADGDEETSH
jgi:large subunit ribosomal protein L22